MRNRGLVALVEGGREYDRLRHGWMQHGRDVVWNSRHEAAERGRCVDELVRAGAVDVPGLSRWSGHSLRRGFATAAKQAGKDAIETGRHGGWVNGSVPGGLF